jgi:hypothetical protein
VLEVLSPLIAAGSLEEVRLMLLSIIPHHPRAVQQMLHDLNQLCPVTAEAANAAAEEMEEGEIR